MYYLLFLAIFAFMNFNFNCYKVLTTPMIIVSYLGLSFYSLRYMGTQKKLSLDVTNMKYIYLLFSFLTFFGFWAFYKGLFARMTQSPWQTGFYVLLIGLIATLIIGITHLKWPQHFIVPIISVTIFLFSLGIIFLFPKPAIDVFHFFKEGAECIASFKNPYTHEYPQIYNVDKIKRFYFDDPVFYFNVPFQPYPPMALFFAFIGSLAKDYRIIYAITLLLTPFLAKGIINKIHPDMAESLKNLLSLIPVLFPSMAYLVKFGWGDTLLPLFLMAFIYFYLHDKKVLSFICLGILFSLKQYTVIFAFLFLFLGVKKYWRNWAMVVAIIALPMAVYAIWDFQGFIDGILIFNLKQVFRPDGHNLSIFLKNIFDIELYKGLPYLIILMSSTALTLFLCFRKKIQTFHKIDKLSFILNGMMFQYFTFLMFAKAAFVNYYTFLFNILFLVYIFSIDTQNIHLDEKLPTENES